MKRILTILMVAILVISLTACRANDRPTTGDETPNTQEATNNDGTSEITTGENNPSTYDGEVTEKVVREHKAASESDFTYDISADGIRITSYIGKDTIVVVKSSQLLAKQEATSKHSVANRALHLKQNKFTQIEVKA